MPNNDKISFEEERQIKENLQRDIDEFISNGGQVQEIEYGLSTTHGRLPFRYDDKDWEGYQED